MADAIDFQPYLKALPDPANHDWGDRYTPTQVELPLKVQAIVPEHLGEPTAQRQVDAQKRERFEVLDGLRKAVREHHHVLLIGKPGSGKSTALRRLLWEEARKCLEFVESTQGNFTVPVLIELRRYSDGSVTEWIEEELQIDELDQKAIKSLLREGRILLLFDGLNEIPSEKSWRALETFLQNRNFQSIPVVVTTRELGAGVDLGIEKKLEMVPLTEPQMRAFIEKRLPGQTDNLLRQLKDRLRELAETPLLLQMLCDVVAESNDGQIPQNRGELFRQEFTRRYKAFKPLRGRVSEDSRRFAPELLQHLAFAMTQGKPHTDPLKPTPSWLTIPKSQAEAILETYLTGRVEAPAQAAKEWLEDLLEFHLLQIANDPDQIEFHHQLFQEYYAAEKLLGMLQQSHSDLVNGKVFQYKYLNYLKWTEAIALMSSLLENEVKALQVLQLALEVDWMLVAQLAGGMKPKWQEQTVQKISTLEVPDWLKIELWGEMRLEVLVPGLLEALENGDCNAIQKAAYVLEKHNYVKAIPALLDAINYPSLDFYASYNVATNTGKLSSEDGIPILLKALQDLDISARLSAVNSLGADRSDLVVELLPVFLTLLQDANLDIRRTIAEALKDATEQESDIRLKTIVSALLQAVNDPDLDVFLAVTEALGNLGSTDAIPGLLRALKTPDECVRARAAMGLGNLGSTKVIPDLRQALKDQDALVRDCAAGALDDINRREAANSRVQVTPIQELIWEIANPFGDSVDERVIDILKEVNTFPEAVPSLLKALEDPEKDLRRDAVEVLGNMVPRGMIPDSFKLVESGLLKLVTDPCSSVRGSVAEVLGALRSIEAIPSLLKLLREDSHAPVRRSVALALGKIGDEEGISELMRFIRDLRCCKDESESSVLLITAAKELSNFKDDRAAHILPDLLTLIPTSYGEAAFCALTAIQANCQFYNYEIAQLAVEEGSGVSGIGGGDTKDTAYTINAEVVQIIEQNLGDVIGQQPPKAE